MIIYKLDYLYEKAISCWENKEYQDAYGIFDELSKKGYPRADMWKAWFYEEGVVVKQNYNYSTYLYKKAAQNGVARASRILGDIYKNGLRVEKNYPEAVEWYKKAVKQGEIGALFEIIRLMMTPWDDSYFN